MKILVISEDPDVLASAHDAAGEYGTPQSDVVTFEQFRNGDWAIDTFEYLVIFSHGEMAKAENGYVPFISADARAGDPGAEHDGNLTYTAEKLLEALRSKLQQNEFSREIYLQACETADVNQEHKDEAGRYPDSFAGSLKTAIALEFGEGIDVKGRLGSPVLVQGDTRFVPMEAPAWKTRVYTQGHSGGFDADNLDVVARYPEVRPESIYRPVASDAAPADPTEGPAPGPSEGPDHPPEENPELPHDPELPNEPEHPSGPE